MSDTRENIWTEERKEAARLCARKWQGTPHKNRIAIPDVGIDCLHFVAAIATAAEILPAFQMPFYKPAWGIGREVNIIERVFSLTTYAEPLSAAEFGAFGDIVIFKVGHQSNHVGIVIDGEIWHCQTGSSVQPEALSPSLAATVQSALRLTGPGFKRRPETLTTEDLKP